MALQEGAAHSSVLCTEKSYVSLEKIYLNTDILKVHCFLMIIPGNESLFSTSETLVKVNSQWGYKVTSVKENICLNYLNVLAAASFTNLSH